MMKIFLIFSIFVGRLSRNPGGNYRKNRKYSSHTKYLSADNQITFVGSVNLDSQSFYYSKELVVAVDDHEITKNWCRKVFKPDFFKGEALSRKFLIEP